MPRPQQLFLVLLDLPANLAKLMVGNPLALASWQSDSQNFAWPRPLRT
jgi:hypothetical protein